MMRTARNVLGSILALAGATAAVWSPFRPWYDGRHGQDYRVEELFTGTGVTDASAQLLGSLFLPFGFAALVTLVGVVLRSRLVVAFAGVVVVGFTVLWMVRLGQAVGSLTITGGGGGLDVGAGNAFVGGAVVLIAALLMAGRGRRGPKRVEPGPYEPEPEPYAAPHTPASGVPTLDDPGPDNPPPAWQRPPHD